MTSPLLSVQGLSKAYGGVRALQGVSLEVGRGEMVALIGPNGAGKSTCYNIIDGQVRADAGTVLLEGRPIEGLAPRDIALAGVGRTFQIAQLFASMTIGENIAVALRAQRRPASEGDALLELCGMAGAADDAASALAYGDVKRLELALALAGRPLLLLMDEPTAGMAADERAALMGLVRAMATDRAMGVLFTEHDMEVVFRHADRVVVFSEGRVIADDAPGAVRTNRAVQDAYLGGL